MSLISVIASTQFISIMSDGRVIEEDRIVVEDYQKVFKVSNNVLIAFTGDTKMITEFFQTLDLSDNQSMNYYDEFAEYVYGKLVNSRYKNAEMRIFIGGLNNKGHIGVCDFDTYALKIEDMQPYGNSLSRLLSLTTHNAPELFEQLIKEKSVNSLYDAIQIQNEIHNYVASKEYMVNDTKYKFSICK